MVRHKPFRGRFSPLPAILVPSWGQSRTGRPGRQLGLLGSFYPVFFCLSACCHSGTRFEAGHALKRQCEAQTQQCGRTRRRALRSCLDECDLQLPRLRPRLGRFRSAHRLENAAVDRCVPACGGRSCACHVLEAEDGQTPQVTEPTKRRGHDRSVAVGETSKGEISR